MRRTLKWLAALAIGGCALALAGIAVLLLALYHYGSELPDYTRLASYSPPTVTRIHAGDGRLLAEYARERRVFVPSVAIPDHVKQAFIAAEDQHFYEHHGIDFIGIARAMIDNVRRIQENRRPQGASTITQQVAKNFLLDNELSLERKIKEAILAFRIESAFSKDHILELYLNEIFLGNRSYGVAAAALNYFDKPLDRLTIAEAAYLAGLPKAPSRYDPVRNNEAAIARRDYVIGRMEEDGYVTPEEARAARAEPLVMRSRSPEEYVQADFFTEEVRRQLVQRFGEEGFYEGGYSVRTTIQPRLQALADRALRRGLVAYDRRHGGWRGPLGRADLEASSDWAGALLSLDPGFELMDWQLAVVLGTSAEGAQIGLADGKPGAIPLGEMAWARKALPDGSLGPAVKQAGQVVARGDVVAVEGIGDPAARRFTLRQRPAVEGALVALDPHTGKVLAMSGGFSYRQSKFNRATQAKRQPGSAFKPFVYLAALEAGYTPASIILDAPIVIDQGPGLPKWKPENYTERFYGPSTLRLGIEKSRNLMTVRLADAIGMPKVIDVAHRFGIDQGLQPYLSNALGSNEVDPLALTTAYAMLVNGGKQISPYLVERIQDRNGRTVIRRDERTCPACLASGYDGGAAPELPDTRAQIEDPRLAYQMVSMLEGVVQRGTAAEARKLGRPLAGKTGTTNDSRDAWFVGFSPDLVAGVFVGYDQPRELGKKETGASVALPIWIDFMAGALEGQPLVPFRTPPGLQLVAVDATTGLLPSAGTAEIINEAFLPGTEPVSSSPALAVRAPAGSDGLVRPVAPPPPATGGLY